MWIFGHNNKFYIILKNNKLIKRLVLNLLHYWHLILSGLVIKFYLLKKCSFYIHFDIGLILYFWQKWQNCQNCLSEKKVDCRFLRYIQGTPTIFCLFFTSEISLALTIYGLDMFHMSLKIVFLYFLSNCCMYFRCSPTLKPFIGSS